MHVWWCVCRGSADPCAWDKPRQVLFWEIFCHSDQRDITFFLTHVRTHCSLWCRCRLTRQGECCSAPSLTLSHSHLLNCTLFFLFRVVCLLISFMSCSLGSVSIWRSVIDLFRPLSSVYTSLSVLTFSPEDSKSVCMKTGLNKMKQKSFFQPALCLESVHIWKTIFKKRSTDLFDGRLWLALLFSLIILLLKLGRVATHSLAQAWKYFLFSADEKKSQYETEAIPQQWTWHHHPPSQSSHPHHHRWLFMAASTLQNTTIHWNMRLVVWIAACLRSFH